MLRDAVDHVLSVGDETYRMVSCLCVMMGNAVTYVTHTVQFYTTRQRAHLVTYSMQHAKSQHPLHIMRYGTPTSTPTEDHTYHAYTATTHPANITHHYTQATHHPICFIPHRMDMIPRVSEHTPTSQQITPIKKPNKTQQLTSLLQTTSSPHCTLTVLLLTVRSMNVKVFEISTSNCLYLHIVLVYLL